MTPTQRRRIAGGLGALTLGGVLALPAAAHPTRAESAQAGCPTRGGVTVIVDFGATHRAACAPGDPTTGLKALTGARFTYAFVQRFPGMVCRINGRPATTQDACVVAPPTTRYWSYWHAKRGGRWIYATTAAGSYNPAPGTVEGWSYGAGRPPTMAPPG